MAHTIIIGVSIYFVVGFVILLFFYNEIQNKLDSLNSKLNELGAMINRLKDKTNDKDN